MIPKERIQEVAERIITAEGCELVDLECFNSGRHSYVRILADRPQGGITIDQIARLSRELTVHLDVELDLSQFYSLEVSSPGIGRPLRTEADFRRNLGRPVAVQYRDAGGQPREARGLLQSRSAEGFSLQSQGTETVFRAPDVIEVKTDVNI